MFTLVDIVIKILSQ